MGIAAHFIQNALRDFGLIGSEAGEIIKPQAEFIFFLRQVVSASISCCVAHPVTQFGGDGGIEAFGNQNSAVGPLLDDDRTFLRIDMGRRRWAFRPRTRIRSLDSAFW